MPQPTSSSGGALAEVASERAAASLGPASETGGRSEKVRPEHPPPTNPTNRENPCRKVFPKGALRIIKKTLSFEP